MNFLSDGTAYVHPEILERLASYRPRNAEVFDDDPTAKALTKKVEEIFEHQADVFPVVTGTASNSLALTSLTNPWSSILCHYDAHIQTDECGGPEMFTGGAKLVGLEGKHGKIDPRSLQSVLESSRFGNVHRVQPAVLSLTQSTEAGTVYSRDELLELTGMARRYGLKVHMDGARFANAIVATGCTPAELSWKAGVDILCLGATKNGAIAGEAVIVFDKSATQTVRYMYKRSGHYIAKTSLVSLQIDAYLTNDLWLRNAKHANTYGAKLAAIVEGCPEIRLLHACEANQIFFEMPDSLLEFLRQRGVRLNAEWRATPVRHHRISASYLTSDEEVSKFGLLISEWNLKKKEVASGTMVV